MRSFNLIHETARDSVIKAISDIPLDGKYKVEIKKVTSKRSDAQNRLWQWWTTIIADELGYTHRELKEMIVCEFIPSKTITLIGGATAEVWPSTTRLNTRQFSKLLNMLYMWEPAQGIKLPKGDDWDTAMKGSNPQMSEWDKAMAK